MKTPEILTAAVAALAISCQPAQPPAAPSIAEASYDFSQKAHGVLNEHTNEMAKQWLKLDYYSHQYRRWLETTEKYQKLNEPKFENISRQIASVYQLAASDLEAAIKADQLLSEEKLEKHENAIDEAEEKGKNLQLVY